MKYNNVNFLCLLTLFVMISCTDKNKMNMHNTNSIEYISTMQADNNIDGLLVSYAIYDDNWNFIEGRIKQVNKEINFKNKDHKNLIVCIWVDNSSIYKFNFEDAAINANYENINCIENNEAYFAVLNSNDDININVDKIQLNSPFTIICLNAIDLEDAKIAGFSENNNVQFLVDRYSKFSFKTLDVYDKVVSCSIFNIKNIQDDSIIKKCIVFAPKDKSVDNSIKISYGNYEKILYNIPFIRGNNLIVNGNFLTSDVELNIKIIPEFLCNL